MGENVPLHYAVQTTGHGCCIVITFQPIKQKWSGLTKVFQLVKAYESQPCLYDGNITTGKKADTELN